MSETEDEPESVAHQGDDRWPPCSQCGRPLYLAEPGRTVCEACRRDEERTAMTEKEET
jgi:hypothetical protein